jgi:polyhydroxyalkanoate synthesis regulator phasin
MVLDDMRKMFEAVIEQLSPAKARELAKRYLEPEAAKEQVSKTANELVQMSQRMRASIGREVRSQMRSMGVATQDELDALRKRVRELERAAGMTASGRKTAARATARKTSGRKTTARKTTSRTTGARTTASTSPAPRKPTT